MDTEEYDSDTTIFEVSREGSPSRESTTEQDVDYDEALRGEEHDEEQIDVVDPANEIEEEPEAELVNVETRYYQVQQLEMDIKIEIKEEVPFSEVISQIGGESFSQGVTMKLNRDTTVCNKVCEMETKVKEEPINSDICPQNDCDIFPKNFVTKANECDKDCEVDTTIEIKEELWWLERTCAEAPCVDDAAKGSMDESSLPSPESVRLSVDATCPEAPGIEAMEPSEIGGECRKRWSSLRDCYRKSLRNKKAKSGQETTASKPWQLEQQMEFRRPFLGDRRQLSNISQEEGVNNKEDDSERNTQLAASSPSSSDATSKKRPRTPVISSIDAIKQYIDYKRSKTNEADHLTKFFQAAEGTVRTFPPYLQIEAKKKISDLLYELEIKTL